MKFLFSSFICIPIKVVFFLRFTIFIHVFIYICIIFPALLLLLRKKAVYVTVKDWSLVIFTIYQKKLVNPETRFLMLVRREFYEIISINLRISRFFWWKVVYVTVKSWSLVNHTIYKKELIKILKSFLQFDSSKVYRIILINPMIYINSFW